MSFQMEPDELEASSQTLKDIMKQVSALIQRPNLLSTSPTTVAISSSKEPTSNPDSLTSEIPQHYDSAQCVSSQMNIDELKTLFQASIGSSFQVLKDSMEQSLTPIQTFTNVTESRRTLLETLKSRNESPSGMIQILEDVAMPQLSSLKALEDNIKLRLTWIQTVKDAMDSSSLSMIPTNEGIMIQIAPTPPAKEMMDSSPLPTTQETDDLMELLQTSFPAPKNPTKPTETPAQTFEVLMEELRKWVQRLKFSTALQVVSNKLLKFELDTNLRSTQIFVSAVRVELFLFQILKNVAETHWCLIQTLSPRV